ncbi:MAG: hypothetical protein A3D41_03860 [Candidatus Sungbacteria bacterium RIFCSPHIGHO2_02_FULL_41_12b]|nr:MAG: hypothetical protein A3D41_03860 [Candidatus Sungbacteria bacterium RIFCSPHIGHO2_02_FULL_41_12b]
MQNKFIEAYNLIKSSERILLATHESPDGDGIASMLAVYNWLESINPGAVFLYSKDEIPAYLKFLPCLEKIQPSVPEGEFNLLIGFDYGDFKRLGLDEWLKIQPEIKIITFDHHSTGKQLGTINLIDTSSSSTAELVYDFFEANDVEFGRDSAKCILCGIMVDTGIFKHSNTTPKTLRVVKNLLLKGVTIKEVAKNIEKDLRPIRAIRLWGEALLRIKIDPKSGLAVSFAKKEDFLKHNAGKEYLSEFSSLMATVPEAKISVFLTQNNEEPRFIRGSLRTEHYKNADVSAIAKHFGGGGHKLASGFRIESTMEETLEKLINIVKTV